MGIGFVLIVITVVVIEMLLGDKKSSSSVGKSILRQESREMKKYGYKTTCQDIEECRSCKGNVKCLECMDTCYNKYGNVSRDDNTTRDKAISCEKKCWEQDFDLVPKIDFGIPSTR